MTSILAYAAMCGGETEGVSVDSREFTLVPGPRPASGTYDWNIGMAGSTTMLGLSVLPLACFVDRPVSRELAALTLTQPGETREVLGIAVASHLAERHASDWMASTCQEHLHDLRSGATVDRYLADQLVLFAALAHGTSRYIVPRETEHLATNLWLIGQFGARCVVERRQVVIDGLGLTRAQTAEGASVRQPTPIM